MQGARSVKAIWVVAATLCALGIAAVGCIYGVSEWIIERPYPLPPSPVRASALPGGVARGAHLALICGCAGCHGAALQGARFEGTTMKIYAPDLGLLAKSWSDADFDRAIRGSLSPNGRTLWIMPSHTYQFVADQDVADLIAYIRTLPHTGTQTPEPEFDLMARWRILRGRTQSEMSLSAHNKPPVDLGQHTAAGRRIAAMSCVECHATDLSGTFLSPHWAPPNLAIVAGYSREEFSVFMRSGTALGNRNLRSMSAIARQRFSQLTEAELNALYDYLFERGSGSAARHAAPDNAH